MALPFYELLGIDLTEFPDRGMLDPDTGTPFIPSELTIDGYDIDSPSVAPSIIEDDEVIEDDEGDFIPDPVNTPPNNNINPNTVINNTVSSGGGGTENRNAREFLIASLRPFFASASDAGFLKELEGIIDDYIKQDYDAQTISVLLPQTKPYQERFKGNIARATAGLSQLSPAEYIQAEEQYNEILKRFSLGDLAKRDTFATLIGGQVSAAELTDRVVNVYDRIRNADPALRAELNRVEGLGGNITDADFAKALLTGTEGANELKRKISTAEISAEARVRQLGVGSAEQLQQLGITREQARAGFETIAQAQPTFEKLAGIYDREALAPQTSQTELEQEVFQGMASERRKRLVQREVASFSGASGISGSALSTQRAGQI
jgi:hypothetical protein